VDYSERITSYLSELPLPHLPPPLLHWQVDPGALRFKSFRKDIYEATAQFSSSHRELSIAGVRTLRLSFSSDADAAPRQSAPVKKKTSKRRQSMPDASGCLRIQQHNTGRDVLLAELSLCVKFLASPSSQQHTPFQPPSLLNKLGFNQTNVSELAMKAMVPLANALSRICQQCGAHLHPLPAILVFDGDDFNTTEPLPESPKIHSCPPRLNNFCVSLLLLLLLLLLLVAVGVVVVVVVVAGWW